ncbi:MAG: CDGSH iron-sulfur domain-containing protein [Planctomycetota bacterium]
MPDEPNRPTPPEAPGRVQNRPFVVSCSPGKYAYCQCQRSARFPFCDGTHRELVAAGTDIGPMKVVLDDEKMVAWCCCGKSGKKPFCDGSHARAE